MHVPHQQCYACTTPTVLCIPYQWEANLLIIQLNSHRKSTLNLTQLDSPLSTSFTISGSTNLGAIPLPGISSKSTTSECKTYSSLEQTVLQHSNMNTVAARGVTIQHI